VYVAGWSGATWDGPGEQAPLHAHYGNFFPDLVVLKLDGMGAYQWHTFYGQLSVDSAYALALDGSGDVYVAGSSDASWDGPGGQAPLHAHSGFWDLVVLKLDSSGAYQWHTFYGSSDDDSAWDLAEDGRGNVFVTGSNWRTWNGDGGAAPLRDHAGGDNADLVVLKLADCRQLSVTTAGTGSGRIASNPAGIDCGATCSSSFDHGTTVTLTATADASSTFGGWSGAGCSGTGVCQVTMDTAKTVTATFTLKTYTLTVTKAGTGNGRLSSNPKGIDCGGDCSDDYSHGTAVTLIAAADAGSTFDGWSGAGCSGTGGCVVTMDAARTVTATFVKYQVYLPMVLRQH
jgi:hypothetical protein